MIGYNAKEILSTQLYNAVDSKLQRVAAYIADRLYHTVKAENGDTVTLWRAYDTVERCRKEVKYEHLSSKDSWL